MSPFLIFLGAVAVIHSPYVAIWFAQRRWVGVRRSSNRATVLCIVAEFLLGMTLMYAL